MECYTCRCRYCGHDVSYSRVDAGRDIPCPRCSQSIRLPGKLATISAVESARIKDPLGLALEAGGFGLMFFFFPWGLFAGLALVVLGWKRCSGWVCGNCRARVKARWAEVCPQCKSKFGAD